MDTMSLPTSRVLVAQLLKSIPGLPQPSVGTSDSNHSLHSATEAAKKQLLTLQVLFPNELLPALDLLDRRLVTRFQIRPNPIPNPIEAIDAPQSLNVAPAAGSPTQRGSPEDEGPTDPQARNLASVPVLPATGITTEHRHVPNAERSAAEGTTGPVAQDSEDLQDVTHVPQSPSNITTRAIGSHEAAPASASIPPVAQRSAAEYNTVYYVHSAQTKSSRNSNSFASTSSYEVRLSAWNCSCPAFAFAAFPPVHPEPPVPYFEGSIDDLGLGNVAEELEDGSGLERPQWIFGGHSLGEGMPPVCKHLLACVLIERCAIFNSYVVERIVSVEEAAGWAAGWGD